MSASSSHKKSQKKNAGTMGIIPIMVDDIYPCWLMHERTWKTIDENGIKIYGGRHSLAGAGGAADGPEPLEDAIVRETREEYGLDVKIVPVQDRKVLAETEDCLSDGSVWSCHWYLLQLSDTKQVPRIPELEKKKATRLVAVTQDALLRLAQAVTSGAYDDAHEDRITIQFDTDTVYFFESLKNLAKDCPDFWKDQFPHLWNIVGEMPNYQANQLKEHGIDMIKCR